MNIEYQNVNTHTLDETFFYKKIHTFFMKKQIRLTLITFILCFILFFSFNYFIKQTRFLVGASSFKITEVSKLSDGSIGFYLQSIDGKDITGMWTNKISENGIIYITGERKLFEEKVDSNDITNFHNQYYFYISNKSLNPTEEKTFYTQNNGIKSIRFGTKDDYFVLWESGMQLPIASHKMEEAYKSFLLW